MPLTLPLNGQKLGRLVGHRREVILIVVALTLERAVELSGMQLVEIGLIASDLHTKTPRRSEVSGAESERG